MDKPMSYYAFEMLYWCGIREGELLALTPGDFDFKAGTVSISKSYQRLHQEDVITTPKTKKSIRTIRMPKFLCDEMQEYMKSLYGVKKKDRIFPVTKSYLYRKCMDNSITVTPNPRILLWFYVPLAFTLLRCVSNLPLTTPFHFAGVTKSTH